MKHETAGDPMTGLKWTRRTTAKVADELRLLGIEVSANTVARLLKTMGFSLRAPHPAARSQIDEEL
jgi:transposase